MFASDGSLRERYEYSPYGERTVYFSPGPNDRRPPNLTAQDFTTCAVCASGCKTGDIYGCVKWGHVVTYGGVNRAASKPYFYEVSRYVELRDVRKNPPLTKLKEFQGIYITGTEGLVVKGPGLPPTNIFRSLTSNPSLDDVLPKV
jgi:hypothetical protein